MARPVTANPGEPVPSRAGDVAFATGADFEAGAAGGARSTGRGRGRVIREVVAAALADDPEFRSYAHSTSETKPAGLVDLLFAVEDEPHAPDEVFTRLRWGGRFVYATRDRRKLRGLEEQFSQRGYAVERPASCLRLPVPYFGLRVPLLSGKLHYFIARKVSLIRPREVTDRFTYNVQLVPDGQGGFAVCKEMPTLERVMARLRAKATDLPMHVIEKRALKFTEKIFPMFLTREAAILKILERDLPPAYRARVPRVLKLEQDSRGYVRKLWMNWLRMGAPLTPAGRRPLSQIEFAEQAADLLRVIHDDVGVIHLDLRLDNFVVADEGVGFVDFGSAVRVGENIQGNPMLATIFEELMRTSQIQRMLDRMRHNGSVTSSLIADAYGRIDKAVDLFYLAVQINSPLGNPDLEGLVQFDPKSAQADGIVRLTHDILKPVDPDRPAFKAAADVLAGVRTLKRQLAPPAGAAAVAASGAVPAAPRLGPSP